MTMQEELIEQAELYEHHRVIVDRGQTLLRIDKFLGNRLEDVSRNKIQQAAKAGNIIVNGKPVKPNYKVKPADVISIVLPYPHHEFELIPENIPLNILFEDDAILVVNKEAGMVVHPGHGNYTGTLVNALAWHLKDLPLFQSGEIRPGLVHRIDKDTSGILVIAKTESALNKLARQFFNRTTQRTYTALVWGHFDNETGTVEGHIGRSIRDRMKMQVFPEGDQGKPAVTHYRVLEQLGYVSLLECRLETGRTHQIRIHMEYIGHPVFNDERYGGDKILRGTTFAKYRQFVQNCFTIMPRHALHAKSLGFIHPGTNKEMFFDSDLPDDFQQVLGKWRGYTKERV
ncbi:MAG: RluA family pseudouridine synthase [Bacteroidales bacterium]|nr:RluA family pseudouridine synthase [Bacteroidales bacterium]MBN2763872.1 RluA family pseudouridine synthase [Bacteroidales bacterium]